MAEAAARVSAILDVVPIIGDIKGIAEAAQNPTVANVVAAGIGLVPGPGDVAGKVVKTGGNIAENAANGAKAENAIAATLGDTVAGRRVTLEATSGKRSGADIVTTEGASLKSRVVVPG